ncbi:MAG: SDR family NAD(P)-dependent oxidoreductase [Candidatus Micrarchaeota archaeon]
MDELIGKVAIITGSSRGIGAGIAKLFASEGAKVIVSSRDASNYQPILNQIKSKKGEAYCIECDVSKEDDVKMLMEQTIKKYGTVDILVNNAGVFEQASVEEMKTETWKKVLHTDLDGVFFCTKYVTNYMKKNKTGGRIINISSVAGLFGFGGSAAYCAAKFAVVGFTKATAIDLCKYGITVNAICPGLIETDMTKGFTNDKKTMEAFMQPLLVKRAGLPEDIAKGALYLASEGTSYVTGTTLVIDGGWTGHL